MLAGDHDRIFLEESVGDARVDTIYDLASLTKVVVTTTLAMMLADEGTLQLGARVREFTIRQLLTHSSGLPATADMASIDDVFEIPLQYTPGAQTLYSDVGMIMLGRIIERLSNKPLDQAAHDRIFKPLGMNDSMFNPPPSLRERIAATKPQQRGGVHDLTAARLGGVAGHAGLFSTALDLSRFCRMMLRGGEGLIQPETIKLFTQIDTETPGSTRALGWDTPSKEGSSAGRFISEGSFGHTGFTGTSMWIDPNRACYIIILTNRIYFDADHLAIRKMRPRLHDAVMLSLQQ